MAEPLQPTPYADVNEVLGQLSAQVQAILGQQFVGMYLSGSLAVGDFDPHSSDIDFIVVTASILPDDMIAALREMHTRFDQSGSAWAEKIEGVYAPLEAVRRCRPADTHYPQIEKGRSLFMDPLEIGWIYQLYTLRKHGMALAGPDPRTLVDPLDPDDMRRAAAPIAHMWQNDAATDPSWLEWLRERANQAFATLTLCRLLYTLEYAAVASKPGAARWAQAALGERWSGLIDRALAGQHDSAAIPASDERSTLDLIDYTVGRFQEWSKERGD